MSYGYLTPSGGFTLEFWFQRAAAPATGTAEAMINQQSQNKAVYTSSSPYVNGRQLLIYNHAVTGPGALAYEMYYSSGNLAHSWVDSTSTPGYANDNEWHHVALRLGTDKRTVHLWLDGVIKNQTTLLSVLDWVPGVMSVGGAYAPHLGNFGYFLYNGGLAYVSMWDSALKDVQITDHYAAGSGGSVFYGDDEVARLKRIYSLCGVPTDAQRFDPPVSNLQGLKVAGQNGLQAVKETAHDSGGLVFADGQSVLIYQNRRHRYNRALIARLTENDASAPDIGMEFATDDTKIFNDVRASRPDGGSARLRNIASVNEYGQRVYELKLGITSDDEMRNFGTWIAERYGEDRVRVSGVSLSAESSDLIQYVAETVNIGDRIAFDDLPNNVPDTYMEFIVEGISVSADFKNQTWSVGLELAPADLFDVFQVGVSTLGDGSRIAF